MGFKHILHRSVIVAKRLNQLSPVVLIQKSRCYLNESHTLNGFL